MTDTVLEMINIESPHYTQIPYKLQYIVCNFINMYRGWESWEGFYYKVSEKLARRINTV